MRFSEVQHQARAISILRRALARGRTHHAYLFDGPEGVGKERAATALAARLLCTNPGLKAGDDACGRCESCRVLAAGNHPDFHLIHRGLHKFHPDRAVRQRTGLFLTVDLVRHFLIEPAANAPALGRRRVFIVRDAERMNEQAQNALLKTLEEPPGQACIVLVTSAAGRLLPTIRSRCQRVPFDFLPTDFVRARLADARCSPSQARVLAALSQGSLGAGLRWAEGRLLDELDTAAEFLRGASLIHPEKAAEKLVEAGKRLAQRLAGEKVDDTGESSEPADAGDEADETESEPAEAGPSRASSRSVPTDQLREGMKLMLLLVAALLREALLEKAQGAAGLRAFESAPPVVPALAGYFDPPGLADAIEAVALAERMLDRNVAPRMACEYLCAAILGEAPAAQVVL